MNERLVAEERRLLESFVTDSGIKPLKMGLVVLDYDVLLGALALALEHGRSEDSGSRKTYSVNSQYAMRYAKMRDLDAWGCKTFPIGITNNHVRILQGDFLDRFLDDIKT